MIETVLWLVIAVLALLGSGLLSVVYYAAWRSISATPRLPIGEPIRIPAWANLRRELLRVVAQSSFLVVGVFSLIQLMSGVWEYGRLVAITGLIIGQICMMVNSWLDWLDDRRLIGSVDAWDQEYIAVPKDQPPTPSQIDHLEAVAEESLARLKRSEIGDAAKAIVNKEQADEIQATGEDTNRIVRGETL